MLFIGASYHARLSGNSNISHLDKRKLTMKVADKTYYLNADKSKALPANDTPKKMKEGEVFDETPDGAAYLLVREGGEVTAEMEKYGIKGVEREEAKAEPGIVTSAVEGNEQGFVSAKDAREAGTVVTEGQDEAAGETADEPKQTTKKSAKKAAKKR
jgi:hypothetical protein